MRVAQYGSCTFRFFTVQKLINPRRNISFIIVNKAESSYSNVKIAKLSARKKDRIKLPTYNEGKRIYQISEFLSQPPGIEAILNTSALQNFQFLDTNLYRCFLPRVQLLNFEVSPVLDLRVTQTDEDCTVEMLSCKFEGSEVVERQNDHFSASMRNCITWDTRNSEPFLDVDVKLNLTLEVFTQPFTMLPISAVEGPGNLMMQALLDRLVPLLLQQLLKDYEKWLQQRRTYLC
ncbi:uncharacterized protein LOC130764424 isoform X2 [Actinidia eriantha]|nr:uncharacterized protein LOC130764424 isoform X2 [Actinidia eriantha]